MNRITDFIQAAHQLLHLVKPLLLELALFAWASWELWRFVMAQLGFGGGS